MLPNQGAPKILNTVVRCRFGGGWVPKANSTAKQIGIQIKNVYYAEMNARLDEVTEVTISHLLKFHSLSFTI